MGRFFDKRRFAERRRASAPPDEVGQALLKRWRRGDPNAFSDIFKTYRSLVYGVLHHLLSNDPELEDVVQTAFVEVYRSLSSFEGRSKLSSWIARVALHTGYHHLRRRKSRKADYESEHWVPDLVDTSPHADPARHVERQEAMRRVYEILDTLSEKKRTVFILNDLQGLPQEEVAEVVGVSIATVRTRLFYARKEFWKKANKDPILADLTDAGANDAAELTRAKNRPIDRGGGDSG
ncbi:MAG: RNA polymerase sigma factor [Deltaproteobacteria bacterium]|jgi:RNA polymerase sigma factor (sigma-70 family)